MVEAERVSSGYVELCVRSAFSFLRGASAPEKMVRCAHKLGYDTLALTDYGGLYGVVRAWQEAKRLGMRLILGAELEVTPPAASSRPGASPLRLTLLVQNALGYQHLCRLLTLAHAGRRRWTDSAQSAPRHQHPEPRLSLEALEATPLEGLFCLLHEPEASSAVRLMRVFGGALRLAIAFRKDGRDRARFIGVTGVARQLGVPIVAVGDVRFADRDDKEIYDVLQCVREKIALAQAGRRLLPNTEARFKSALEMRAAFERHPEWLEESRSIAAACTFCLSELEVQFPSEAEHGDPDLRLRALTLRGMAERYPSGAPLAVREQVERELTLIAELRVAPYFLSVADIVQMARDRNILCQGRGSAANSVVCFCLGITAVDPARHSLLFERFLSADRHEPPDIDVDFEHERREEVIAAIYEKYGRDRAAMVSEVSCYRQRSALRDVAKVFGESEHEASLPAREMAKRLVGLPRHLSIHVGGFVLSARSLHEVAPVEPASMPQRTIIPWDKDDLDALGFFKIDVLALGMLSGLHRALDLVFPERASTIHACLAQIPAEDPVVYAALGRADTVGVFQIESRAQMSMLPRLLPRSFYDLVIEVALVRPGPIQGGMVHPYLRRREGLEPVSMPHESLRPILQRTLGVPLFQEQVMQLAIVGAGYTGGEADQLRRDMAAWRRTGNLERHRERLLAGFAARGVSREWAERIFAQIHGFAEYGFPESHAASFALLVYASAWLKVRHPAAFVAALVNSQPMGFYSVSTLLQDAERHGVELRPIDINHSAWLCTLEGDTRRGPVRIGLAQIKGLGAATAQRIVAQRGTGYTSVEELVHRAALPKDNLEALAEAGALEALMPAHKASRRSALYRSRAPRAGGLFAGQALERQALPALAEPSPVTQLAFDYAHTGHSLNAHPMSLLRAHLPPQILSSTQLRRLSTGRKVEVAGLVIVRQRPQTASGVVFLTLEDEHGFLNLIVHAKSYERLRPILNEHAMLRVTGTLQSTGRGSHPAVQVLVEDAEPIEALSELNLDSLSRNFH